MQILEINYVYIYIYNIYICIYVNIQSILNVIHHLISVSRICDLLRSTNNFKTLCQTFIAILLERGSSPLEMRIIFPRNQFRVCSREGQLRILNKFLLIIIFTVCFIYRCF